MKEAVERKKAPLKCLHAPLKEKDRSTTIFWTLEPLRRSMVTKNWTSWPKSGQTNRKVSYMLSRTLEATQKRSNSEKIGYENEKDNSHTSEDRWTCGQTEDLCTPWFRSFSDEQKKMLHNIKYIPSRSNWKLFFEQLNRIYDWYCLSENCEIESLIHLLSWKSVLSIRVNSNTHKITAKNLPNDKMTNSAQTDGEKGAKQIKTPWKKFPERVWPQIKALSSTCANLFRIVIYICLLICFSLQVLTLLKRYIDYPTQTEIFLNTAPEMRFPAVTVCSENPVK